MSPIENDNGVHSKERTQVKGAKKKTTAQQYAEHHKLDFSMCDSDKVEDRGTGVVKILQQ